MPLSVIVPLNVSSKDSRLKSIASETPAGIALGKEMSKRDSKVNPELATSLANTLILLFCEFSSTINVSLFAIITSLPLVIKII